jgi:esterase/lipase
MKDTVILFIHGFYGHVEDFTYIKKYLDDNGYNTHTFTLSGHDKVKLEKVTRKDWINDCEKEIEKLKKEYKNIIIIGHSMGGVLTSTMAVKYKEVKKIILLAPSFEYFGSVDGKLKIIPTLKRAIKLRNDNDFKDYASKSHRVSVPVIREFMKLIKEHTKDIYDVECPILMIVGDKDFVVPLEKVNKIYEKIENKNKKIIVIKNGIHWFLSSKEVEPVLDDIKEFIRS